jgi:hypothetical protein
VSDRSDEVTTALGANADLSMAVLPAFHGTRRSPAESILQHGFRPLPVDAQIAAVAERYSIPVETLIAQLKAHHRFAHIDERPGTVSLTADSDQAGSWANRRRMPPGRRSDWPTIC